MKNTKKNNKNNINKNNRNNHKKSKKKIYILNKKYLNYNRNKKAGAPKINFAYTYFLISLEDLNKNNLISFNKFISYKSKICDCLSLNIDKQKCNNLPSEPFTFKNVNPKLAALRLASSPVPYVLTNNSQKLIIVLQYDLVQQISNNINLLENKDIQNQKRMIPWK